MMSVNVVDVHDPAELAVGLVDDREVNLRRRRHLGERRGKVFCVLLDVVGSRRRTSEVSDVADRSVDGLEREEVGLRSGTQSDETAVDGRHDDRFAQQAGRQGTFRDGSGEVSAAARSASHSRLHRVQRLTNEPSRDTEVAERCPTRSRDPSCVQLGFRTRRQPLAIEQRERDQVGEGAVEPMGFSRDTVNSEAQLAREAQHRLIIAVRSQAHTVQSARQDGVVHGERETIRAEALATSFRQEHYPDLALPDQRRYNGTNARCGGGDRCRRR